MRLNTRTFVALAALTMASYAVAADLPDPSVTPGALNPDVTQENILQTVCVKGYSKTIRPPENFTNKLKKQQIREYDYADRNPKHYEEDQLVPLSLGGSPRDPQNLWPEPRESEWGADKKDQLEFVLYRMVCQGETPIAEAQHEIATDWIAAWKRHVPSHRNYKFKRGFF